MKEKPILFSAPMVRAILDGRKTQTRRVIKVRGKYSCGEPSVHRGHDGKWEVWKPARVDYSGFVECPHGTTGDRLWVKETFQPKQLCSAVKEVRYAATDEKGLGPWKPSIFMPRKFSRITLEIVSVRVERLQDINGQDSIAEGIESFTREQPGGTITTFKDYSTGHFNRAARQSYQTLWESINGNGSWDKNPWVWVIEFEWIQ